MFKDEAQAKSILILQKKGEDAMPPKQALLANLPSFANQQAMREMMAKLDQWIQKEK